MTAAGPLRVLVVTPYRPYPPNSGSAIRVYQLVRHLSGRHTVSLVTYGDPADRSVATAFDSLGVETHVVAPPPQRSRRLSQVQALVSTRSYQRHSVWSHPMQAAIDAVLTAGDFDLLQFEQSKMCVFRFRETLAAQPSRGGSSARRVLVVADLHDIEHEVLGRLARDEQSVGRRVYYRIEQLKLRREEAACWRDVDGCSTTSAREELIIRQYAPSAATAVVPNGVDLEYFAPAGGRVDAAREAPDTLLFVGFMSYQPNADAVRFFARKVLPLVSHVRPSVRFMVVGGGVPAELEHLAGPRLVFTGQVPDVRPYLGAASVVVAPLRAGSGTRVKILDALAMAKPIVATAIACEGLTVRDGEHLRIADTPPAFAEAVLELLGDRDLGRTIGERGRALVEREYGWQTCADRLEAFYRRLISAT